MNTKTAAATITAGSELKTGAKAIRLTAIDIVRGLAMVAMLTVHAASRVPDFTFRSSWGWSVARNFAIPQGPAWLGLLLAMATPAFFLLAGFGIALFESARRRRGWTEWQITRYLLIRGAVLIALDFTLLGFRIPEFDYLPHRSFVLLTIGLVLWTIAIIRRIDWRFLVAIALGLTIGTQIVYELTPIPTDVNYLRAIFLYPSPAETITFGFPYLAWLPVMLFGYLVMRYLNQHRELFTRVTLGIGGGLLAGWLLLTLWNEFGVLYTAHPLIVTKQPPMLAYLTLYLGITFTLLGIFHRITFLSESWLGHKLSILGQTALFFYIMHYYVYTLVNPIINRILPLEGFWLSIAISIVSVIVLYIMSYHYRNLRRAHPDSVLKYL